MRLGRRVSGELFLSGAITSGLLVRMRLGRRVSGELFLSGAITTGLLVRMRLGRRVSGELFLSGAITTGLHGVIGTNPSSATIFWPAGLRR
jgi:hypothetical protein